MATLSRHSNKRVLEEIKRLQALQLLPQACSESVYLSFTVKYSHDAKNSFSSHSELLNWQDHYYLSDVRHGASDRALYYSAVIRRTYSSDDLLPSTGKVPDTCCRTIGNTRLSYSQCESNTEACYYM